jgi:hypothetical protein
MRIQPQLLLLLLPKTKNKIKNKNQEPAESKCQEKLHNSLQVLECREEGREKRGDGGRETKPNIRSRIQPDKAKMGHACNWGNLLLRI